MAVPGIFAGLCYLIGMVITSAWGSSCPLDRLVLYQVTMKAHWSREAFPRHYPEFRPPAQWSKIVGGFNLMFFTADAVGS